jgi:probable addiction module antidote protein
MMSRFSDSSDRRRPRRQSRANAIFFGAVLAPWSRETTALCAIADRQHVGGPFASACHLQRELVQDAATVESVNDMNLNTFPFDAVDAIDTPQERAGLLAEAFASGDAAVVTAALGLIARARGITQVSRETGLSREALYKATGAEGNPTLATLLGIMRATGLKLSASAGRAVLLSREFCPAFSVTATNRHFLEKREPAEFDRI